MRIVLYGPVLGEGGYLTELPFLLNGKIERIYKDATELQDLEADIAIANFSRTPEYMGNKIGFNYARLPKVKVQLVIQAEHYDEYIPEWVDGYTHNFDGSVCYPFNKPFWDFDDTIYPCFAKSYWEEHNVAIKPVFYFDPLVKWNNFYSGPVKEFKDYGYIIGGTTKHRNNIVNADKRFKYMWGDMRDLSKQKELKNSGIGFNVHKFEVRGANPETEGKVIKCCPKTESIRLSIYYNLGMAIVTEKLDHTFPERLKSSIIEMDDILKYNINKDELLTTVNNTEKVFNEYHDLNHEQDLLINSIIKHFGI
jgi:hypothetical protein